MSLVASEIVFPLTTSPSINESCVFRYDHGPVKVKASRRRGQPVNCISSLQAISSIETNFTLVATRVSASKELSKRPRVANNDFHFIHMAGYNANSISDENRITIRKRVMDNYMHCRRKPVNGPNHIPIDPVREIAQVDPFDAFPIKLEPYMLDLLKYYMTTVWKSFYTIESLTSINPMTDYWIPLAFCDDALLHLLIGCADSHNARCMHFEDRPIALRHMNKALSIMKIRIATMRSVTDATIASIATLAFVEKMRGSFENWRIHMGGLKRLVDLRGGLGSLETKPLVMTKVFRADLCGSIDSDKVPFFAHHYLPPPQASINTIKLTTGFDTPDTIFPLDDNLTHHFATLNEAAQLTSSLMTNKTNVQADAARIRFLVTRTQYTLLSTPKYLNTAHELCRLVLILYSESLVNESPPRLPICDVLIAKFRGIWLMNPTINSGPNDGIIPLHFKLWAVFVAASMISVTAESLMNWYLRCILETASWMRISGWGDLVKVFETFLWDERVHARRYLEIWNDSKHLEQQV